MSGPGFPVPAATDDVAADQDDSTTIFDDEQDVSPTRALVLPLVAALVGVGLLVGAVVGIVAVVTAPAWSAGVGALAQSTQTRPAGGGDELSGVESRTGVDLPDDAEVLESGPGSVGGTEAYVARVAVAEDPADLLAAAGYSPVNDVPSDLLAAEGADFGDPRFSIIILGNDVYTALTGTTSDGRTLIVFSAPLD